MCEVTEYGYSKVITLLLPPIIIKAYVTGRKFIVCPILGAGVLPPLLLIVVHSANLTIPSDV